MPEVKCWLFSVFKKVFHCAQYGILFREMMSTYKYEHYNAAVSYTGGSFNCIEVV